MDIVPKQCGLNRCKVRPEFAVQWIKNGFKSYFCQEHYLYIETGPQYVCVESLHGLPLKPKDQPQDG
jgi:hypothetical protein